MDQKMERYRETQDESVFTQKDFRALYGRFETARNTKDATGEAEHQPEMP